MNSLTDPSVAPPRLDPLLVGGKGHHGAPRSGDSSIRQPTTAGPDQGAVEGGWTREPSGAQERLPGKRGNAQGLGQGGILVPPGKAREPKGTHAICPGPGREGGGVERRFLRGKYT